MHHVSRSRHKKEAVGVFVVGSRQACLVTPEHVCANIRKDIQESWPAQGHIPDRNLPQLQDFIELQLARKPAQEGDA
jgi:hypothetical protein